MVKTQFYISRKPKIEIAAVGLLAVEVCGGAGRGIMP